MLRPGQGTALPLRVFLRFARLRLPTLRCLLLGAGERQGIGGDILGDGRTGGDQAAAADPHRGDELGVAADEDVVLDERQVLVDPVVIAGDGAAADIDPLADLGVAEVGEMAGLDSSPSAAFLVSTKLPILLLPASTVPAAGAPSARWHSQRQAATVSTEPALTWTLSAERQSLTITPGSTIAVAADNGLPAQMHAGMNDGIRADVNLRLDVGGGRIEQRHPGTHVAVH